MKKKTLSKQPIFLTYQDTVWKYVLYFTGSFILTCLIISFIYTQGKKTTTVIMSLFKPHKKTYNYNYTGRTHIDPALVKEILDAKKTDVSIFDIRSRAEYKSAHIKSAVNLPAYTDFKKVYETQTDKNTVFKEVKKSIQGKRLVILYGYSPSADTTLDMADFLKKQGVPVRVLSISWNEWRNNFYNWLPNAEKQSFIINTYLEGDEITNTIGLPQI